LDSLQSCRIILVMTIAATLWADPGTITSFLFTCIYMYGIVIRESQK